MLNVGGDCVTNLHPFLSVLDPEARKEMLARLNMSLLTTNQNSQVPKWIIDNYSALTKEIKPVIDFANRSFFTYTRQLLDLTLLTELPKDIQDLASVV